ncbi:zinc-binding dehydrogenase [Micromonospora sp. M12]
MTTDTMITEVVLPGVVEPDGLLLHRRAVPVPARGRRSSRSRPPASRSPSSRCATTSTPASRSSRSYPATTWSARSGPWAPAATSRWLAPGGGGHQDRRLGHPRARRPRRPDPVPLGLDPAEAETVVVNGVTAWQMLRGADLRAGQTILVHGANGGVGTVLVQLGRHLGLRVIGTAAARHHAGLRELGVEPLDYRDPEMAARVRELSPGGVDAVFDPIAGPAVRTSYDLLAPGGKLVVYGNAAAVGTGQSLVWVFLKLLARLYTWNALPNGHRAGFYNFWAGQLTRRAAFRRRLRDDLGIVLDLLRQGVIVPQIAARYPQRGLRRAGVRRARSRAGKVVLEP